MLRNFIILTLASFAFVACETRSDVEIANEENILIMGNSAEPKGLDPHLVSGVLESNIIRALFEGLCVEHPSKNEESLPGAAKSWTHSPDYTQWTFSLNPDAKWSDGVPVTARDFAFAYKRLLSPDPNWPAKYAEMLYFLKNAEAYHKNKFGHILCGNDTNFPLPWDTLKEANFDGDPTIKLKSFNDKKFEDLKKSKREKLAKYLQDGETIDLSKITPKEVNFNDLSSPEKRIYFNAKGIDKLSEKELTFLKTQTDVIKWTDKVPENIRQIVLDRIIEHHKAKKPSLWDKAKVGVTIVDDFTLKLDLRGPVPFLHHITKHYTWFPVPKHVVLKYGEINTGLSSPWTKVGNIVSNGAFKLKKWRTNHILELDRNPHYWDNENVHLNGIRYLPVKNLFTETRMFGDGQLHITYKVPAELLKMAEEKYPKSLRKEDYVGVRYIRVNTAKSPFTDPKVRRAFALAIDQKALCDKVLMGGQQPASGIVPPFGDSQPAGVIQFDPEEAKKLLAESEFADPASRPEITLLTTDSDSSLREAVAYQAMWEKHLGIKVRILQREWSTYLSRQFSQDYDLAIAGWIGDFLDPTTFLEMWITDGGNNNTGWGSKQFEDLLKEAENTADPAARLQILAKAEKTILDDTPILPVYWYATNYLIRPEVKNWHPLLLNNHPFKFVKIEK